MDDSRQVAVPGRSDGRFLWWWLAICAAGVVGLYVIDRVGGSEPWVFVAGNGSAVGVAQGLLVRSRTRMRYSAVAIWAVGCTVGEFALLGLTHYDGDVWNLLVPSVVAGAFGVCAGTIQDAVMPAPGGVWILLCTVCSAVGWPLGIVVGSLTFGYEATWELGWLFSGALAGICFRGVIYGRLA